jgi:hypothetical protein
VEKTAIVLKEGEKNSTGLKHLIFKFLSTFLKTSLHSGNIAIHYFFVRRETRIYVKVITLCTGSTLGTLLSWLRFALFATLSPGSISIFLIRCLKNQFSISRQYFLTTKTVSRLSEDEEFKEPARKLIQGLVPDEYKKFFNSDKNVDQFPILDEIPVKPNQLKMEAWKSNLLGSTGFIDNSQITLDKFDSSPVKNIGPFRRLKDKIIPRIIHSKKYLPKQFEENLPKIETIEDE